METIFEIKKNLTPIGKDQAFPGTETVQFVIRQIEPILPFHIASCERMRLFGIGEVFVTNMECNRVSDADGMYSATVIVRITVDYKLREKSCNQ